MQKDDSEDEEEIEELRAAVAQALSLAEREAQASQAAKAAPHDGVMDAGTQGGQRHPVRSETVLLLQEGQVQTREADLDA